MISVVSQNCNGFINRNMTDSRTEMLMPLALLTDSDRFETESDDSVLYKKSCDLYDRITNLPQKDRNKRYGLFAMELKIKYADKSLKKYDLLSEEELKYIIDFIDTYGGFRVYQQ